jgi:hypothetical protein
MRQEVDIRYVVTSLKGSAQHFYETIYCQREQMENLIKLHKAHLASDRMSCHSDYQLAAARPPCRHAAISLWKRILQNAARMWGGATARTRGQHQHRRISSQ